MWVVGAVALAVPLATSAAVGGPALFAGASSPTFPVACNLTANVAISPPLTKAGTHTTNPASVTTVTITSGRLAGCLSAAPSTAPGHGTLPTVTLRIPATSLGRINGVRTYATGYCPAFSANTTLKALRGLVLDVTWAGGVTGTSVFTAKKAAPASNNVGEIGFTLSGKEGTGLFAEKPLNQVTAFFDATDSAALLTGCAANQVVSAPTIDKNNSVAIL